MLICGFISIADKIYFVIAAIVASMHIAVTLYDGSIKVSDNGKMNKANPVTLFNVLCMDNSFSYGQRLTQN